jgi:hypothetical protein
VSSDAQAIAVISVIAVAPLAIVLIIALLRGYTMHLTMSRDKRDDH